MSRRRLREDCGFYQKLLKIEQLYDELGIDIEVTGNVIIIDRETGTKFIVGKQEEYNSFPRDIETPFYVLEDEQ